MILYTFCCVGSRIVTSLALAVILLPFHSGSPTFIQSHVFIVERVVIIIIIIIVIVVVVHTLSLSQTAIAIIDFTSLILYVWSLSKHCARRAVMLQYSSQA
jgi:hypothetical protein